MGFAQLYPKTSVSCLIICCVALCTSKKTTRAGQKDGVRRFSPWFKFGSATASYQVEGAWNEDGKSENIWDHASHRKPCVIAECHTGDIADDSYHQVERDVEMMRELGLDYYRFSLSWTRVLPTSFPDKINEAAVQYYNKLINEMLKYNIEPMITIYHWDLPQNLQEMGGWTNPYIVDWFSDYARICFKLFGDRVENWITINGPYEVCFHGYGDALKAPFLKYSGWAGYICSKNVLLAHAKVYHMYDEEFRPTHGGTIGIAISIWWFEPENKRKKHKIAVNTILEFNWGFYVNPIFSETGDYPAVVKERVAAKSAAQGCPRSRLPELTAEEVAYIKGTSDYLGINHYSSALIRNNSVIGSYDVCPRYADDAGVIGYQRSDWKSSSLSWLKVVSWGFYSLLTYIRKKYNNPPVYITENGFPTFGGLDDDDRVSYYYQYLDAMLDAIDEGSDVRGYTAWSLMDKFEWMEGYKDRFGLYEVDYEDPTLTRTPRKSAFVYKQIVRTRQLDPSYNPTNWLMTID